MVFGIKTAYEAIARFMAGTGMLEKLSEYIAPSCFNHFRSQRLECVKLI